MTTTPTTPADLTTASPAEIDRALAAIEQRLDKLAATITMIDDTTTIALLRTEMSTVATHGRLLSDEFLRRGGWTRYYLVEGGHLHANAAPTGCSRTFSTVHYWVTEWSGLSADSVIELAGERVCTNCFPSAPVKPRPASGRLLTPGEAYTAAHAEQRARDKAARKAAQITTPDGGELRTAEGDLVKTANAANRKAMEHAYDLAVYGTHPFEAEWIETIDRMVAALAHAQGRTEQDIRDGINRKIAAKMRREQGEVLRTI